MVSLPRETLKLYHGIGWKIYLYARIRSRLCPIEKIAQHIPLPAKLLDLGCGVGLLSNYIHLRDPQTHVVGIDLCPARISTAQATVGNRTGIQFIQKNALELDSHVQFDTVTMTDFLHHLSFEDQRKLLECLFRRLPSGGRLVIQEVIESPPWKHKFAGWIDRLLNRGKISNFRTQREWRECLESLGYRVEVHAAHQGLPLSDAIFVALKP